MASSAQSVCLRIGSSVLLMPGEDASVGVETIMTFVHTAPLAIKPRRHWRTAHQKRARRERQRRKVLAASGPGTGASSHHTCLAKSVVQAEGAGHSRRLHHQILILVTISPIASACTLFHIKNTQATPNNSDQLSLTTRVSFIKNVG